MEHAALKRSVKKRSSKPKTNKDDPSNKTKSPHNVKPSAPPQSKEPLPLPIDDLEAEIKKLASFEIIENEEDNHKSIILDSPESMNPTYPQLNDIIYGFTAPDDLPIQKEEPTKSVNYFPKKEPTQTQDCEDEEAYGSIFKVKNSSCIRCSEPFLPSDPVVIATCKHAMHLTCCINETKLIKDTKKCFMCAKYKTIVESNGEINLDLLREKEEEIVFEIDDGNPEVRRRNERKRRLKLLREGRIDMEDFKDDFFDEEEPAQTNSNVEDVNYEIGADKISALYDLKGIGEPFTFGTLISSVSSIFKKAKDSDDNNNIEQQKDDKLSFEFLKKNSITLSDLAACDFNLDDIYSGIKITDLKQLGQLKLKEEHFETIFTDFDDFVNKYDANFRSLDEAMVVHIDWLLSKTEKKIEWMKRLEIDFDCLVDDLFIPKNILKVLEWKIDDCISIGMGFKHLEKFKITHLDMIEMKWDFKEVIDKFKLSDRQKEHLGIDDSVINFISSSLLTTKKKKKTRKVK
jgi:hypothetical protein